jgi:hypothetical protein
MNKFRQLALTLALAAASAAQAASVSFDFTGTLDDSAIAGYDVGSTISGRLTYDTDTLPAMEAQEIGEGFQIITYGMFEPGSLLLNIGGDALSFSVLNIAIVDGNGTGEGAEAISILAEGMTINGQEGDGAVSMTFATLGTNQDLLTLALPSTMNLADFDAPIISPVGSFLTNLSSDALSANFTLNSLSTATAVPEAGSALTMLMGLGLMGGLLMKRRRAGE